jgi:hypothetical protein
MTRANAAVLTVPHAKHGCGGGIKYLLCHTKIAGLVGTLLQGNLRKEQSLPSMLVLIPTDPGLGRWWFPPGTTRGIGGYALSTTSTYFHSFLYILSSCPSSFSLPHSTLLKTFDHTLLLCSTLLYKSIVHSITCHPLDHPPPHLYLLPRHSPSLA